MHERARKVELQEAIIDALQRELDHKNNAISYFADAVAALQLALRASEDAQRLTGIWEDLRR